MQTILNLPTQTLETDAEWERVRYHFFFLHPRPPVAFHVDILLRGLHSFSDLHETAFVGDTMLGIGDKDTCQFYLEESQLFIKIRSP